MPQHFISSKQVMFVLLWVYIMTVNGRKAEESLSSMRFNPRNIYSSDYLPPNVRERKPHECDVLTSIDSWFSLIHVRCPAGEGMSNIGWPYDLKQLARYSCGYGPSAWSNWTFQVHIMNASLFMETIRTKTEDDWCLIANFYAPYCPFSARLAPWYNALPRVFPRLFVTAIDATEFSRLNNRYGIAGSPSLLLWHNGKAVARFDDVDYTLPSLEKFLTRWTDLEPLPNMDVSDDDMFGPLPTAPVVTRDYYLILAYVFVVSCSIFYGVQTETAKKCWENIRGYWRDANLVEDNEQRR